MRLHSVSLYNNDADVLWLSEGALGPDEHNVVIEAIEYLKAEKGALYHELGMEDGRAALFLGLRGPRTDLLGTVMILADMKSLGDNTMERILTVAVKTLMQKMAVFLRKTYPQASDTSQMVAMPTIPPQPPGVVEVIPPGAAGAAKNAKNQTAAEPLAPRQVEAILTLELVDEPSPSREPPKAEKPKTPPPGATKPAPVVKAVPKKTPPAADARSTPAPEVRRAAPPTKTPPATPPRAQSAPPAATPPPPREIEVLAFDADVSVPTARPSAPAPPADIDVLPFDANIEVPTAHPAPAGTTQSGDIEVLDFDAELTMPPTRVSIDKGAPREPPVAKSAPAPTPAAAKAPATPAVEAKPAAAKPASAPAPAPKAPPARPASTPAASPRMSSSAATVSVPVLNTSSTMTARVPKVDEEAGLINDTGPVKKLEMADETTTIEPVLPAMPPPPPLTAEETATDLTLFVQELIKLRSSGRTRRYEVLARSLRDAQRNEVPTAFVAETARGREGAALDALVVERLLQWLGQHGETIWDSEPASFSVNLSIGAIEDESFPEKIGKWLEQYSVPAEYVGFEVSELACVQCRPAVQRFVDACEKLGCFLVIDNFSFDSNMFELLGSKTLRHVKIDPKLTRAAMKDKLPQALVVAILQACKVLGVHCVAKRIESQSSLQWLTAVGCDFAQSFQLEKPTAIDTLVSGKSIKALRE